MSKNKTKSVLGSIRGQGMIEYMLLFTIAVAVIIFALRHEGFVTSATRVSIDRSVCGIEEELAGAGACPSLCDDGICNADEDFNTCPEDCSCPDGICQPFENLLICPQDCLPFCGDTFCTESEGETCDNCIDCACAVGTEFCDCSVLPCVCTPASCPDFSCQPAAGEDCSNCSDCACTGIDVCDCSSGTCICTVPFQMCGNGIVEGTEECDILPPVFFCDEFLCVWRYCGDGDVDPGEECDGGFAQTDPLCDVFCKLLSSYCGNGILDTQAPHNECCDPGDGLGSGDIFNPNCWEDGTDIPFNTFKPGDRLTNLTCCHIQIWEHSNATPGCDLRIARIDIICEDPSLLATTTVPFEDRCNGGLPFTWEDLVNLGQPFGDIVCTDCQNLDSTACNFASGCFVATASFGSQFSEEVQTLQGFRDSVLGQQEKGIKFVNLYYKTSPDVARFIENHSWLKPVARIILQPLVKGSEWFLNLK